MSRILAIDYGNKRVGLAVTDPLQLIAVALDTVHSKDVIDFVVGYCQKEVVERIVIGWPKTLENESAEITQHIVGLKRKLNASLPDIPVSVIDERYTSRMAQHALFEAGYKKKDRRQKENIDMVSAVIILQSYMEMKSNGFV